MFKTVLKRLLVLTLCLSFLLISDFQVSAPTSVSAATAFANGADVGWLAQMEATGYKFYNDSGVQKDCLQILKDHGINSIRLRAFVNPSSNPQSGHCSTAETVAMAVRAKNMGMRIMLDLHYSDTWADPGNQIKPAAWVGHSFATLLTDVYNYTYGIMNSLKASGVYPEWVQVGNEIPGGMIYPEGKTSNWSQLAQLINQGYNAIKAVNSASKVILHLDQGNSSSKFRTFFDNAKAYGAKYDVIGVSYYPYWLGSDYTATIANLQSNLTDMASRYGKEVMVCEVGGDYTKVQNTYDMLKATINAVKAVPNSKGLGVFYWEPEGAYSWSAYQLSAWGANGRPTAALDAFLGTAPAPTPPPGGNLLTNPGFESNGATQTPTGWSEWDTSAANYTETVGGAHSGSYHATHWKAAAYSCSAYQKKTSLANGTYKLTAWVKSSGGQTTAQMYAKGFGGTEIDYSIKTAISSWTQITINNINVTNGTLEVGFYSVAKANNYIYFDDVSLTKN